MIRVVVAKEMVLKIDYEERQAIGFAINYGFTSGSLGSLEWEIERGEYADYIAIGTDIMEGVDSSDQWELTIKRYTSI